MGEFDDLIPNAAPAKAGVGAFDDLVPVRDMTAPGFVFHQPTAPEPIDETAPYSERKLQEQQNVNRQVMANVLPPTPNELEASRQWGPMESIFKTGKILRAGLADVGTAAVKEPDEPVFRNVQSVYQNKPVMPVDAEMANAGKAISYPYKAASGLIETAPQLAATMVAPEVGVPAWLAGGAAFGFDEQGNFKPVNAAIGALLPGFGKVVSGAAERIALKYGVSNETALTLIKAASATGAAGTVLGTQAAYDISKLPVEQRKDAAIDAVLGILGPSLLGLTEIVGERDHAKAMQSAMDNEAKLKALLNSSKFVIPGTENRMVPSPNAESATTFRPQPLPPGGFVRGERGAFPTPDADADSQNRMRQAAAARATPAQQPRAVKAGVAILVNRGVPQDQAEQFTQYFLSNSPVQSVGETFRTALNSAFDASGMKSPTEANTYSNEEQLRRAAEANQFSEEDIQTGIQKHAERMNEINQQNQQILQQLQKAKEPNAIQIGSTTPVHVEPAPQNSEEVGGRVPVVQPKPADAQAEEGQQPKPNAPEAAVNAAPLPLKSGDVAPVKFHSMLGPMPYFELTQDIIAPDSGNVMKAGEKITKAVLDKYGIVIPPDELAKAQPPVDRTVNNPVETQFVIPDAQLGSEFTASTPRNEARVIGRYAVVESDVPLTSEKPGFDKDLQNRGRFGKDTTATLEAIARQKQNHNPDQLGTAATVDTGAPTIDELGQITSGNLRTRTLRELYGEESPKAAAYKAWLTRNAAEFGLNPETIGAMKAPVLVRQVSDYGGLSKPQYVEYANRPGIEGMTDAERARSDAMALTRGDNLGILNLFAPDESGNVLAATNRSFLLKFIEAVGGGAELRTREGFNGPVLEKRVKNAMLAMTIGADKPDLIQSLIEGTEGYKNLVNGMMRSLPNLMRLKGTEFDITDDLGQALSDLVATRSNGQTVQEFLSQDTMFGEKGNGTPTSDELLVSLDKIGGKSAKAVTDFLNAYTESARQEMAAGGNAGLFGDGARNKLAILKGLNANRNPAQTGLALGKAPTSPPEPEPPAPGADEGGAPVKPVKPPEPPAGNSFPASLAKRLLALSHEKQTDGFGPENAELRRDILEAITGTRPPKSKSGAKATGEALAAFFGIDRTKLAGASVEEAIREKLIEAAKGDRQAQLPTSFTARDLSNQISSRDWWHVPPAEKSTYEKRGKFYSSSFKEAEFYGISADAKPERVAISNPLIGDESSVETELLGGKQTLPEPGTKEFYKARTELDRRLAESAREKGYDAIALTTPKGFEEYRRTGKIPRSIELNTLHDLEQETTRAPIRWVGGKRQFLPVLQRLFAPYRNSRLVEPFFGSGTVTFGLRPSEALVNDLNPALANFHQRMAKGLTYDLPYKANAEDFSKARTRYNELVTSGQGTTAEAAKLFYYLNQMAHGGLYRVNSRGEFNVSFQADKEGKPIRPLEDYRDAYKNVTVKNGNYDALPIEKGDFIYSDPPYDSQFANYDATGFSWEDQQKHAEWLANQKVPVMTQNEATPRIVQLYRGLGFDTWLIPARRSISRDAANRGVGSATEVMAFKNIPADHIAKALEGTGAVKAETVRPESIATLGEETATIRPTTAIGLDEIRQAFSDPRLGYDPNTVRVALDILKQPVFKKLDWSKLIVAVRQKLEGNAKGAAWIADNLIELSGAADATTFPHEIGHVLFELLPKDVQDKVNQARLFDLREKFGDNIPDNLRSGRMTSDAFQRQGLDYDLYSLISPSEYMANFMGDYFSDKSFAESHGPPGFIEGLVKDVKAWVRAIVNTIKRSIGFRVRPDMIPVVEKLLAGKWKPTPESARAFEERQAQLPRRLSEYEKQRAFEEPGTSERTMGAYGDVVSLKSKFADDINAGEKARKMVMLTNQELLASAASIDMATPRLVFGNYDAMRQRTEGSDMGLRSGVIVDAFRGLGYEQQRMISLRAKLAAQEAVVGAKSFKDKILRLFDRKDKAETSEEIRKTYANQIAQQAGDVMRELNEKGKTEGEYEGLRTALARLTKMKDFNEAVTQRVNDIVDVVASTPEGMRLLEQGGLSEEPILLNPTKEQLAAKKTTGIDRTGTQIARAYMDIKQSIADLNKQTPPGAKLSKFDRQYLSEQERQRLESNLPMFDDNAKAFIQLASQVLSANAELRLKLATAAHYRIDPEFKAQVDAVGEKFKKQYLADPNNAIKQIVKTASSLKAKEINAQNAWLRLHKQIVPEIQKLNDLQEAVEIDNKTVASNEWKQLVNQIYSDNSNLGEAYRIPDSEIPLITSNTVWNEFTGRQQLRSPTGGVWDVDIGFTKASALKAQGQMEEFLSSTAAWLGDPANANSPDRAYWNMRYDFVEAGLNTSTVLSPTVTYGLGGVKGPWGMMEFLGESSSLPAAKLSFSASNNFQRSWAVMDQWFQGSAPEARFLLRPAAKSHLLNADTQIYQYRDDVLSLIASEYRHGRAVKAGDRLISGAVVTPQDMKAFRYQGKMANDLFNLQKNIAREKLMVDGLLLDQWATNIFGIRSPQELGAEPGTTLPHEFSLRGQKLAERVAAITPGDTAALTKLFDDPAIFEGFVKRFIDERRADYSTLTPFEDLYKQLAEKWRNGEADAPRNISEILDYLEANSDPKKYTRQNIEATLVGEMESQLRKYHKNFVAKEELSDVRADRATKNTAFTQGFQRDVGNSFFYDYGAVTTPEVRAMGVDSTNFHLVRFVRSLDGAVQAYDRALAEFPENEADRKKFIKERYPAFKAGDDYRDFERLQTDRANIAYLREMMSKGYGRQQIQTVELFSKAGRVMTDLVTYALSGPKTIARVLVGSQVKMGLTMGGVKRWYMAAYPEAMISTVMSAVMMPTRAIGKGITKGPGLAVKAVQMAKAEGFQRAAAKSIQVAIEGFYRQGKYFNQQYQFGLGFKAPVGFRAFNIWLQPFSHGGQYQARFSSNVLLRMPEKAFYYLLSKAEAPFEIVKTMFPNAGYAVSYDAAARMASTAIDGIAYASRRSFEYLEKTGQLGHYDFNRPASLKNILPADYFIPRGIWSKGETNAYQARDWWQRAIDVPLNEMVINYWKKLSATPREQRGEISFLASDVADPAKVKQTEEARAAALMTVPIKNVHHAATENRPIQLRQDTTLRFLMPLAGWGVHSARETLQKLGLSPRDSRSPGLLLAVAATTILGFTAYAILSGEQEKGLKKVIDEQLNGQVSPEKMIWEARDKTEAAKLMALDSTAWMSQVHSMAASLLGESSQTVGQSAISVFPVQKITAVLQYAKGVIATHDPSYGLASFGKQMVPLLTTWINHMEGQKGLVELKNARTIVQKFGPEQLLDKETSATYREPTQLTPLKQALSNAVYRGDTAGVSEASQAFVAKAIELGQTPEQANTLLRQAMASINPLSIGGRKMTDAQRQEMMTHLGTHESDIINRAESNWNQANNALGFQTPLVKQERQPGAGGGVGAAVPAPRGPSRIRSISNRLRLPRGRQVSSGYRAPRVRVARLSVPRSRFRRPRATNKVRRRSTLV